MNFYLTAKIYLNYISIFFSQFSGWSVFSTNEVFNSSSGKNPFDQIIKKCPAKGVFVDLLGKYLGMNAALWSKVCVWFWIFKNIFENFCDVCERRVFEIVLIISSNTEYEFSAAIFIFKVLMWNVYHYHEMLADIDRREKYKRFVAYGFHSWQINWYLTSRREKLFMKTSIASRLCPICFWFSFDPRSYSWLNVILSHGDQGFIVLYQLKHVNYDNFLV